MSNEHNLFQKCRDDVISKLVADGEQGARTYIGSLEDSDYRDAARVHLAQFLAQTGNLRDALVMIEEVENVTERCDGLLAIERILDSHHRLKEARELLHEIEKLSKGTSDEADFKFLVAVELNRLGLSVAAVQHLRQAIALTSKIGNDKRTANAALWLARWGVSNEPEEIISGVVTTEIRDRARTELEAIREFQHQPTDQP